jgi:aspartyl-tRNA(Asn)/glutamyl-tRNA(Gln) amidotransferase subunit B
VIEQETRLFDSVKGETRSMRSKEEAHDYRYFPDPDLLPLELPDDFVEKIRATLPELPDEKRARFMAEYGLSSYDAGVLVAERETSAYYEGAAKHGDPKQAANWIITELFGRLNKAGMDITQSPISAANLGKLLGLIKDGTLSGRLAKDVFTIMFDTGGAPDKIVEERGMKQVTDTGAIEAIVDKLIADNPGQVATVQKNPKVAGWFTGQVMKATGGKANPGVVNEIVAKKLGI